MQSILLENLRCLGLPLPDKYMQSTHDCFYASLYTVLVQVDIASDGMVDWDEFCTYLMLQFEENDQATKVNGNTFIPKPNIVRIDHNKVCTGCQL